MKLRTGFSKISFIHLITMLPLTWIISTIIGEILKFIFLSFSSSIYSYAFLINYIVKPFMVIYLLICIKIENSQAGKLLKDRLNFISPKELIRDILVLFIIVQIMNFSNLILINYFDLYNPLGIKLLENSNKLTSDSTLWLSILSIIGSMFMAPITEELFFRGWILNRLLDNKSTIFSIVLSSILFSLGHGPGRVIGTFMIGVILAILYLKYQNIGVPIIFHIIHNSFLIIGSDALSLNRLIDWSSSFLVNLNTRNFILMIAIIFFVASIGAMIYFMKKNWPSGNQAKFFDTSEVKFD